MRWIVGLAALVPAVALAQEPPAGGGFVQRWEDGWFWYEQLAVPPPQPEEEEPVVLPPPSGEPPAAAPLPLSAAWLREQLPVYLERATDAPTPENVRAYLYLQKIALDKADVFSKVSQALAASDPFLDANTERPLSPFASKAADREATDARRAVLQKIAGQAGVLFFFRGSCVVCDRQADVVASLERQHGFTVLPVSVDGGRLGSPHYAGFRRDDGQAQRLGVVNVPALYLVQPPDVIRPLAMGALDLDTLTGRIIEQAFQEGWIDEDSWWASRPVKRPYRVLGPGDLPAEFATDPAAVVAALQAQLGLSPQPDGLSAAVDPEGGVDAR